MEVTLRNPLTYTEIGSKLHTINIVDSISRLSVKLQIIHRQIQEDKVLQRENETYEDISSIPFIFKILE
jgi:hypothetical protein